MSRLTCFVQRFPRLPSWIGGSSPKPIATSSVGPAIRCSTGPVLEGIGLQQSFGTGEGRTVAVQDVSLELLRGELNLLMGPSGSGKSTLLAVLSALLRPEAGQVRALEHDLWRMSDGELERFRLRHCSYIFQGYNLFPALTARQQLEVVLRWGEGIGPREARKRSDHVLGQLGLSRKTHLRPAQLSGGEKQRVAIARALVKNPTFVFADEPTSALDWDNGQQVMDMLRESARERGATVLVVTHDPRLTSYADRIFEMADGRLHQPPASAGADTQITFLDLTALDMEPLPSGPRLELQEPGYAHTP